MKTKAKSVKLRNQQVKKINTQRRAEQRKCNPKYQVPACGSENEDSQFDEELIQRTPVQPNSRCPKVDRFNDRNILRQKFHEELKLYRQKYVRKLKNSNSAEAVFVRSRSHTPNSICICCNRLLFAKSMVKTKFNKQKLYELYKSKNETISFEEFERLIFTNVSTELICITCKKAIEYGRVSRYAISNGLGFPEVPPEIRLLNYTERLLLSPYIPFLQIHPMEKFGLNPQYGVKGSVVFIPTKIIFHEVLPANGNIVHGIIKRCLDHKTVYSADIIRPQILRDALRVLMQTPLYKDIQIDEAFFNGTLAEMLEGLSQLTDHFPEECPESVPPDFESRMKNKVSINGITNRGNFSFMNSVLQLIANISQYCEDDLETCDSDFEKKLKQYTILINNTNASIVDPDEEFRNYLPNGFGLFLDPFEYLVNFVFDNVKELKDLFSSINPNQCCLTIPINDSSEDCQATFQQLLDKYLTANPNYTFECNDGHYLMFRLDIPRANSITLDIEKVSYCGNVNEEISISDQVFELISSIYHVGYDMEQGYYITYRKDDCGWFKCHDTTVSFSTSIESDLQQDERIIGPITTPYILVFKPKNIEKDMHLDEEPLYDLDDHSDAINAMVIDRNFPVEHNNNTYVIAPGQGKKPICQDNLPYAFEHANLDVFAGQPSELAKHITLSDRIKCYSTNFNPAMRTPRGLFYMALSILRDHVKSAINMELRKGNTLKMSAIEALDKSNMDDLVSRNKAFLVTKKVRSTPGYFHSAKLDLWAMIRQLGIPTLFMTFSAGEAYWVELIILLVKLQHDKDITEEEVFNMTAEEKNLLIQNDPGTCARYFHEKQSNLIKYLKSSDGPFGEHMVVDFFIRHEFQMRGSPHIHVIFWLRKSPKLDDNSEESKAEVVKFVDTFISCKNDKKNPYVRFQQHRHTKTCNKGKRHKKGFCRFGFPKFPMKFTSILDPLPKEDRDDVMRKNLQSIKNQLLHYFKNETNDSYEDMLDKLKLREEDYIAAIRSSINQRTIFLKRRPADVAISNYCPQIINAWETNFDIQFILNEYALASYILNYVTKDESGMVKSINDAIQAGQKENKSLRDIYKIAANTFLNLNLMSAQEAFYHCAQLDLVEKSRSCIFIDTNMSSERNRILKRNDKLRQLPPDSTEIFDDGLIEKYLKRGKRLKNVCLAYFAATYLKLNEIEDIESIENPDPNEKLKIIRYPKCSLLRDEFAYYRQQLMLFLPWTNETRDLDQINLKEQFENKKNRDTIRKNSAMFNVIEEDLFDEILNEVFEKHQDEYLDEIDEFEADRIPPEEEIDYLEDVDEKQQKKMSEKRDKSLFTVCLPPRIDEDNLNAMMMRLNKEQRKIVMHFYHCFKNGINDQIVLMTGPAGTGKSLTITALYHLVTSYFDREGDVNSAKVILTAPTGKAAFLINGQTLHVAFKIMPTDNRSSNTVPGLSSDLAATLRIAYKDVKLVFMDEISMVSFTLLNKVNVRMQQIFGNNLLFGGKAVLMVGDFSQLSPVKDASIFKPLTPADSNDRKRKSSGNAVSSETKFELNPIMNECGLYQLHRIERQKDDLQMITALNEMSTGHMSQTSIEFFKARMRSDEREIPLDAIRLMAYNKDVDKYNDFKISSHPGVEYVSL